MAGIYSSLYRQYYYNVFPYVKSIRGSTRLFTELNERAAGNVRTCQGEPQHLNDLEWDNIILLDGARLDTTRDIISKDISSRISAGSSSRDFVAENFSDGEYKDTVVITANPHYKDELFEDITGSTPDEEFEAVFQLFETHWNDTLGTVLPSPALRRAETAEKLYDDEKKINTSYAASLSIYSSEYRGRQSKDESYGMEYG